MKVPYVIYADFEAILNKMKGCERSPESKSYTEKIEKHEACGYTYKVVRSDGKVVGSRVEGRVQGSRVFGALLTRWVPCC